MQSAEHREATPDNTDENSLLKKIEEIKKEIEIFEQKLEGPQKLYQDYLKKKTEYDSAKKKIIGDKKTPQTLAWFEEEKIPMWQTHTWQSVAE